MDAKASESVAGLGRVLVMFEQQESAQKAMASLAGRQFAGTYAVESVFRSFTSADCFYGSGRTVLVAYESEEIMF